MWNALLREEGQNDKRSCLICRTTKREFRKLQR